MPRSRLKQFTISASEEIESATKPAEPHADSMAFSDKSVQRCLVTYEFQSHAETAILKILQEHSEETGNPTGCAGENGLGRESRGILCPTGGRFCSAPDIHDTHRMLFFSPRFRKQVP